MDMVPPLHQFSDFVQTGFLVVIVNRRHAIERSSVLFRYVHIIRPLGVKRDDERPLLSVAPSECPPNPLNSLTQGLRRGGQDGGIDLGDVDALVEAAAGQQC
jgi:hypothetical protein